MKAAKYPAAAYSEAVSCLDGNTIKINQLKKAMDIETSAH
jgi:hypothetical protein